MRSALCNAVYQFTGRRICCGRIASWTARMGQRWDACDVAPWNL